MMLAENFDRLANQREIEITRPSKERKSQKLKFDLNISFAAIRSAHSISSQ